MASDSAGPAFKQHQTQIMVRVRFAPSPTGPLHIGGVRTALYDYLLAKKHGGSFILRIEDTDQKRFVPGAEEYIIESLKWMGMTPDEGPGIGGDYGPYRQSERKELYAKFVQQLLDSNHAYYAFDTSEELDAMRARKEQEGSISQKYDATVRLEMKNSLSLSDEETQQYLDKGENITVRLKVDPGEVVSFKDIVRGHVEFKTDELDDKVLMKADGLPTYHMANIVDDKHMEISHVIRGEEWLSSTAHHILLYRALGWEDAIPQFAHLPLLLKPVGKGKLGKRDGAKFGFPVFPLNWEAADEPYQGFKEFGILPEAAKNFLAFLGWNPGTDQEIFSEEELIQAFSLDRVNNSGARFDVEKGKWYNQQYIIAKENSELAEIIKPMLTEKGMSVTDEYLIEFCGLMKERVELIPDFYENGKFFFEQPTEYDEKTLRKKYKEENNQHFHAIKDVMVQIENWEAATIEEKIKGYIKDNELGFGAILPILRVTITGTMKGPDIFKTICLLGKEESVQRMEKGLTFTQTLKSDA